MQEDPMPSAPQADKKSNTLAIVLASVVGVLAVLLMLDVGLSTLKSEGDQPFLEFTRHDDHLQFHYITDPSRRTIKTVSSLAHVPRNHRDMVIVTERGVDPLQADTVHVANLAEESPLGTIRAHRLQLGQVFFAMDMEARAEREFRQRPQSMEMPTSPHVGSRSMEEFTRDLQQMAPPDANPGGDMPSRARWQKCSRHKNDPQALSECMQGLR